MIFHHCFRSRLRAVDNLSGSFYISMVITNMEPLPVGPNDLATDLLRKKSSKTTIAGRLS